VNPTASRALLELARLKGIQLSYVNAAGQTQAASAETLVATLGALGTRVETGEDILDALQATRSERQERRLEPVAVAWGGKPKRLRVAMPAESELPTRVRIHLEDGQEKEVRLMKAAVSRGNKRGWVRQELVLPALPLGYHTLEIETAEVRHTSLIISAPIRSYAEPGENRQWGVFLPLYAAHSNGSWGAGNLRDRQRLSQWIGSLGGEVLATLPLLAGFLDHPTCAPSPYSPASRLFWNEFYLDIDAVPELASCPPAQRLLRSAPFQKKLNSLRQQAQVEYGREMAVRRQVLELLARSFFGQNSPRRREFKQFLKERPAVEDYARFRAVCDQEKSPWHAWPERQRQGRLRPGDYADGAREYHLYVQWLAHEQFQKAAEKGRAHGVRFYLDLPLGVHPDGYDVWRERHAFALGASAGAPPDSFFSKGQAWGFAPLHPQVSREDRYRYVLEYLRFQMRQTGRLRIDHVMGLHRLYWVPKGVAPSEGAYVTYPADEFYALLCLESHRHKTTLVGENLGTVPPEVNSGMKRHGLRQMYVLQFEQRPDKSEALRTPPVQCVASINTHDMPTFAAHWGGGDIADRADLGLLRGPELTRERKRRRQLNLALSKFLLEQGFLDTRRPTPMAILRGCLKWLSASPAELVLINLEDLWLELLPQNVPGTFLERPNWQRKARFTIEEMEQMPELERLLLEVDRLRKRNS
jgi:4-alpha-glucanotransferase